MSCSRIGNNSGFRCTPEVLRLRLQRRHILNRVGPPAPSRRWSSHVAPRPASGKKSRSFVRRRQAAGFSFSEDSVANGGDCRITEVPDRSRDQPQYGRRDTPRAAKQPENADRGRRFSIRGRAGSDNHRSEIGNVFSRQNARRSFLPATERTASRRVDHAATQSPPRHCTCRTRRRRTRRVRHPGQWFRRNRSPRPLRDGSGWHVFLPFYSRFFLPARV